MEKGNLKGFELGGKNKEFEKVWQKWKKGNLKGFELGSWNKGVQSSQILQIQSTYI